MAVATTGLLSAGKGAALIREKTGRSCSRQNLEKLCKQGRLPKSCTGINPVRVRADLLVEEYLASVDSRQAINSRPGVSRSIIDQAPDRMPAASQQPDDELPPYTESQKRKAFEQANLLELERRLKEDQLVERKRVEATWAAMISSAKTKLMAVPSRAKQRIPHLSLEEIDLLSGLVREALEDLAGTEVEE